MIPLSKPQITKADIASVNRVLRSGRLACGPMVKSFEAICAERAGVKHAIACSSGTMGLYACLMAHPSFGAWQTPTLSFVAAANAIHLAGKQVEFTDLDGMLPEQPAVTVDLFGIQAETTHVPPVIQDACEAIGTPVYGDAAVWAFYPNKQITTGEGGMILTNDDDLANRLRSFINQGRDTDDWMRHDRIGLNLRMDEMSAALGLSQMKRLEKILNSRWEAANTYSGLIGLWGIPVKPLPRHDSWFVYVVTLPEPYTAKDIQAKMKANGIETKNYFPCVHLQPAWRSRFPELSLPNAEALAPRLLALPFWTDMPEATIKRVVKALGECLD